MPRPVCWECQKQLMYVNGKPVFTIIEFGGEKHKVHKDCAKRYDNAHAFIGKRIVSEALD